MNYLFRSDFPSRLPVIPSLLGESSNQRCLTLTFVILMDLHEMLKRAYSGWTKEFFAVQLYDLLALVIMETDEAVKVFEGNESIQILRERFMEVNSKLLLSKNLDSFDSLRQLLEEISSEIIKIRKLIKRFIKSRNFDLSKPLWPFHMKLDLERRMDPEVLVAILSDSVESLKGKRSYFYTGKSINYWQGAILNLICFSVKSLISILNKRNNDLNHDENFANLMLFFRSGCYSMRRDYREIQSLSIDLFNSIDNCFKGEGRSYRDQENDCSEDLENCELYLPNLPDIKERMLTYFHETLENFDEILHISPKVAANCDLQGLQLFLRVIRSELEPIKKFIPEIQSLLVDYRSFAVMDIEPLIGRVETISRLLRCVGQMLYSLNVVGKILPTMPVTLNWRGNLFADKRLLVSEIFQTAGEEIFQNPCFF